MNERLRYIMKSKGLTQKQFAESIGITQNAVTNYVTGRRTPSAGLLNNICKTHSVNEVWLRTGEGEPFCDVEEDAALAEWIGRVMNDESMILQKRALQIFKELKQSDYETLANLVKIAYDILNESE